jgi:peptidoglycan/xylan/chitin deacetylase (PgdA/CDA1 family)
MTWDQVSALRSKGFEIGSHTRNHVDLGVVTGDAAKEEILGGREKLSEALGEDIDLFSYPYGRANQITEDNRQLVKDHGFSCCLSAHGGSVRPGDSPFRLLRTPISQWHRSPEQFGLESAVATD